MGGPKLRGGADFQGGQATNAADGSAATDLVTLQQLQAYINGLDWKPSVRVGMTSNVTITAPGATLDGITMVSGDRVLLMGETTASTNGLYVWNGAAVAMTRTTDADGAGEVTAGMVVTVTEGTANGDKAFTLTTNDPLVIGTTSLAFTQMGGTGVTYTAADASIVVSGTTIQVKLKSGGGVLLDAVNGLQVDSTYTGLAKRYSADCVATTNPQAFVHNLGTKDLELVMRNKTTDEVVYPSYIATDINTSTVDLGGAPTAAQWRITIIG